MEDIMKDKYDLDLDELQKLHPFVAVIAWDIYHNNISENTCTIASAVDDETFFKYNFIPCLSGGDIKYKEALTQISSEWLLKALPQLFVQKEI
jgi:hypothetical protein